MFRRVRMRKKSSAGNKISMFWGARAGQRLGGACRLQVALGVAGSMRSGRMRPAVAAPVSEVTTAWRVLACAALELMVMQDELGWGRALGRGDKIRLAQMRR